MRVGDAFRLIGSRSVERSAAEPPDAAALLAMSRLFGREGTRELNAGSSSRTANTIHPTLAVSASLKNDVVRFVHVAVSKKRDERGGDALVQTEVIAADSDLVRIDLDLVGLRGFAGAEVLRGDDLEDSITRRLSSGGWYYAVGASSREDGTRHAAHTQRSPAFSAGPHLRF